jgi:hypothetical protein
MDEHDDDLDSEVHEDAEEETDSFPDTSDELDDVGGETADGDEDLDLDEDETEL